MNDQSKLGVGGVDITAYPNLLAILEGRVSGRTSEWPAIRTELSHLLSTPHAIWPVLPKEPPPGLLMSMAIRYDHDLGVPGYYDNPMFGDCLTHAQRLTSTLTTMRQLYEEVSGHGFYRPEKEAEYAAQSGHNAWTVEE
jgi:hypothetical protein